MKQRKWDYLGLTNWVGRLCNTLYDSASSMHHRSRQLTGGLSARAESPVLQAGRTLSGHLYFQKKMNYPFKFDVNTVVV